MDRFLSVAAAAVLLFSLSAPAGGQGSVTLGDTDDRAVGTSSAVAAGQDFLLVWKEGPSVIVRGLDAAGGDDGSPVAVDEISSRAASRVGAAATASEFMVVWDDPSNLYDIFRNPVEILAQRFDRSSPAGNILAIEFQDDAFTGFGGVAARENGHFAVSWGGAFNYLPPFGRARVISPGDEVLERAFFSNTTFDIAAGDAGFAVGVRGDFAARRVQELAEDGAEVGAEIELPAPAAALAHVTGEGFLVVWRDGGDDVQARRLDAAFAADGAAFPVAPDAASDPRAFETPGGGAVVSFLRDTPTRAAWLSYIRPDGVVEPALEIAAVTTQNSRAPEVAVDRLGRFVATWADAGRVLTRSGQIDRGFDIDAFSADQPALALNAFLDAGGTASSVANGLDLVGGERDLQLTLTGGTTGAVTVEVTGGALVHTQGGDTLAVSQLVWDQADGDATALDTAGLRDLDLTAGGSLDAIEVDVAGAGAGARFTLEFGDGSGVSSFVLDLPAAVVDTAFVIPWTDFSGTADVAAVGYFQLEVDGSATPGLDATVRSVRAVSTVVARMEVDDGNGGVAEPGDVLEYRVEVENPVDGLAVAAPAVAFQDAAPVGTEFVCAGAGAPTTTQGAVAGCSVGQLDVDLGTLADGATATLTYQVTVLESAAVELCNAGLVASATLADVLTDDVSTPAPADATCLAASAPGEMSMLVNFVLADDADGNGDASAGDTLRFIVVAEHTGGVRDAVDMIFTSGSERATPVPGSVIASQGTVTSGNVSGDTRVEVDLGTIAAFAKITVIFELKVGTLEESVEFLRLATEMEGAATWVRELLEIQLQGVGGLGLTIRDSLLVDVDDDGFASPGDTLRYDVELINRAGRDVGASFGLTLFEEAALVAGSVIASQGSVELGNDPGDTDVSVDGGILEGLGAGVVSIQFDAVVSAQTGADQVLARGKAFTRILVDALSDDPDTAEPNDVTVTPVVLEPAATASLSKALIVDVGADGLVQTGDQVFYSLQINNTGTGTVHETLASTVTDPAMRPVCGSVTVPPGAVVTCSGAIGGALTVDLGRLANAEGVEVTWVAEAIDPQDVPVCAQVAVTGLGVDVVSDDPDVVGAADPSCLPGAESNAVVFIDGFESGDVAAWSASAP